MGQGDFSGQQWLISMPLPANGGYYQAQNVPTDVPVPVCHDDGNSQGPQNHGGSAGKIAGGLGAAYAAHKLWNKLT